MGIEQMEFAIELRDRGVARVKSKNSDFIETMRGVARMLARRRPDLTITADDLREWLAANPYIGEPTHHNAFGAIFCRNHDFEFAGYTKSRQPQGHGNLIRRWKLRNS